VPAPTRRVAGSHLPCGDRHARAPKTAGSSELHSAQCQDRDRRAELAQEQDRRHSQAS
jgi:hypothetical protein